jgi:hypothetical protein
MFSSNMHTRQEKDISGFLFLLYSILNTLKAYGHYKVVTCFNRIILI